ncbi:hypothetical protein [Solibacillus sp. FSL K6-1523]|uniref:hypothetical protein n=1 Tax=Solibacillus sp. FSL K6-1523 TaxID=2921471 RepID=UPI0030FBD301
MFFRRCKLIKNDKKFSAKLLFKDVSPEKWDQDNLTKEHLDFSIDSVRLVNEYADRLMKTDLGQQLLKEHPDNFTMRIGAYLGEVIKNHASGQYRWFDFTSIKVNTVHLNDYIMSVEDEAVLYSRKLDKVICPIYEVKQYFNGKSNYNSYLTYVEGAIKN